MWDEYCFEGKSLLSLESTSKLNLSISHVITDWLPQEIIENILIRLPIKSLIKFTSVCEPWNSTIKHTPNVFTPTSSTPVTSFSSTLGSVFDFLYYDNKAFTDYGQIELPVVIREELINGCFRVVGTCNGLVLLTDVLKDHGYSFVVWNPSIRKYVELLKPSLMSRLNQIYEAPIGFGYDAVGKDYKVVRIATLFYQPNWPAFAQVYSLAEGSWGDLTPSCA